MLVNEWSHQSVEAFQICAKKEAVKKRPTDSKILVTCSCNATLKTIQSLITRVIKRRSQGSCKECACSTLTLFQVGLRNEQLSILTDMDEKLKKIDEFNANLKAFDGKVKEVEDWLPTGRQRMDDLLNPDNPISAEDRVVQTMELQVRQYFCSQRL